MYMPEAPGELAVDRLEVLAEVLHGRVAVVRAPSTIARLTAAISAGGASWASVLDRLGRVVEDLVEDRREVLAAERLAVGQSSSYERTPIAKMSVRRSIGSPRICSGARYAEVPSVMPVCVRLDSVCERLGDAEVHDLDGAVLEDRGRWPA